MEGFVYKAEVGSQLVDEREKQNDLEMGGELMIACSVMNILKQYCRNIEQKVSIPTRKEFQNSRPEVRTVVR